MRIVDIQDAGRRLAHLIEAAATGEDVVIFKVGAPIARLLPVRRTRTRQFGRLRGKARIADDFDGPLPDDLIAEFEGDDDR